jgi:hypothetical protein
MVAVLESAIISIVLLLGNVFLLPKWWFFKKHTKKHWYALNAAAAVTSLCFGLIASTLSPATGLQQLILIEASAMLGFNFVSNGYLDWTYRKMPRWNLVVFLILQALFTVTTQLLLGNVYILIFSLIISLVLWILHLFFPKLGGMSDGRLWFIYTCSLYPIMLNALISPILITCALAVVSQFIKVFAAGVSLTNKETAHKVLGVIKSKFPLGPTIGLGFTIGLVLFLL